MDVIDQVRSFCLQNNLVNSGEKILLAVSGGPDSVALLYIFHSLQTELHIEIAVAHLEHGLRAVDSLEDQAFVRSISEKLGVSFYTKNMNIKEMKRQDESPEEAARRVRYQYFSEVLVMIGYDKLATGHTLDDNVETILYRLITGTGPSGFVGILPKFRNIIHPLLNVNREQIIDYLTQNGLEYRIDKTNYDPIIVRNKIRSTIIPALESINSKFKEHILNFTKIIQDENNIINRLVTDKMKSILLENGENKVKVRYQDFLSLEKAIKKRIIIKIIEGFAVSDGVFKRSYIPYRIVDYLSDCETKGNKTIYQNDLFSIQKEYEALIFKKRVVNDLNKTYLYYIEDTVNPVFIREINRKIVFHERSKIDSFEENRLYFDYHKLKFPLIIRNRKNGDRISLVNIGSKKLKSIFINDKVSKDEREKIPIILSNNEICGIFCSFYGKKNRSSEKYLITGSTERILECELV